MVDAMVRSMARDMPQQLVQLADSSSELKTLIESHYVSWYEKVYSETITRLETEDPLPEFCDQAAGCSKEIETTIKEEVFKKWMEIFTQFIETVKHTDITTKNMIETSW
jgi:predicted helicase